jgi:GntR family transcriptional regulator
MHSLAILFRISPSSGVPIYRQIIDQVQNLIAAGHWPEGTMLPSVRQMAVELEINMMTVSKAYARLETDGVVERVRGTGMRVKAPTVVGTLADRKAELKPFAESLITRGRQLGLSPEQIQAVVKSLLKE